MLFCTVGPKVPLVTSPTMFPSRDDWRSLAGDAAAFQFQADELSLWAGFRDFAQRRDADEFLGQIDRPAEAGGERIDAFRPVRGRTAAFRLPGAACRARQGRRV